MYYNSDYKIIEGALSMSNHFLTEITINKFKGFEDFTANKFKRVNLIGGRNNIGKTSFMEACHANVTGDTVEKLSYVLSSVKFRRENLNILMGYVSGRFPDDLMYLESSNGYKTESNVYSSAFSLEKSEGRITYKFSVNGKSTEVNKNEFSFVRDSNPYHNYIDSFGCSYMELVVFYAGIQAKNREIDLDSILKQFDDRIQAFKIMNGIPKCLVNKEWIELNELGDGARHLIAIISAIFFSENGYLFIDEIDNGVHYTFLDEIWRQIFKLSKELNCQVFATTHSRECIEAFNRANKEDDGVYLEFYRNEKTKKIQVKHRGYQQLDYSLNSNGEFRGE